MTKTQCPNCKAIFEAPDESAGKEVKCPKCGQFFIIRTFPRPSVKPNAETAQNLSAEGEHCSECTKPINKLEQRYVYRDRVVCAECYQHFRHIEESKVKESYKQKAWVYKVVAGGLAGGGLLFLFLGVFGTNKAIQLLGSLMLLVAAIVTFVSLFIQGKGKLALLLAVLGAPLIMAPVCNEYYFEPYFEKEELSRLESLPKAFKAQVSIPSNAKWVDEQEWKIAKAYSDCYEVEAHYTVPDSSGNKTRMVMRHLVCYGRDGKWRVEQTK